MDKCEEHNLQCVDIFKEKLIQTYEMLLVRHGLDRRLHFINIFSRVTSVTTPILLYNSFKSGIIFQIGQSALTILLKKFQRKIYK